MRRRFRPNFLKQSLLSKFWRKRELLWLRRRLCPNSLVKGKYDSYTHRTPNSYLILLVFCLVSGQRRLSCAHAGLGMLPTAGASTVATQGRYYAKKVSRSPRGMSTFTSAAGSVPHNNRSVPLFTMVVVLSAISSAAASVYLQPGQFHSPLHGPFERCVSNHCSHLSLVVLSTSNTDMTETK